MNAPSVPRPPTRVSPVGYDSHDLIKDAQQATNNPFTHPQTGKEEYISCFYVANAGDISEQARTNFFNTLMRKGIRDARLLDGKALVLLDKSAAFTRTSLYKERVTGLQLEAKRNLVAAIHLLKALEDEEESYKIAMLSRFRSSAADAFLAAPIPHARLTVDLVNEYWEHVSMCNHLVEVMNTELRADADTETSTLALKNLLPDLKTRCMKVNNAAVRFLLELGQKPSS
ncbi:hypothetical protein [Gemmata sp.]|uniref:hypothetical protein n=1 Tax=Gemmata sp. TaxID=1914242 RepID=UPI003F705C5B